MASTSGIHTPVAASSRGPVVDGNPTLLVGDRVWADTAPESREPPPGREPGQGGCPIIPVVNNVPDSAALAAVEADPNCFTLTQPVSWRIHAAVWAGI